MILGLGTFIINFNCRVLIHQEMTQKMFKVRYPFFIKLLILTMKFSNNSMLEQEFALTAFKTAIEHQDWTVDQLKEFLIREKKNHLIEINDLDYPPQIINKQIA